MSDQDANPPVEAANEALVEAPESKPTESDLKDDTTASDDSKVKTEETVDIKDSANVDNDVEMKDEAKQTKTDADDIETSKVKAEVHETNGGHGAEYQKPSVANPPKGMLRVYRDDTKKEQGTKTDPSALPDSNDPFEIRKQVEFYFSDVNLPDDGFLMKETGGEENKPVPVSLIATFKRMRRFKPYSVVVEALKNSPFFVIEGSEGEETIRRKDPYDPNKRAKQDERDERSIYVKGFGEEQSSTQFDIEAFFAQYGEFNAVRLRRAYDGERKFKGSAFIEWANKDTAEKFMAIEPQPTWKGHPLLILWKLDYMKQKLQSIKNGDTNIKSREYQRGGRRGRGRGNHRGTDPDDWKKRRERDQEHGFNDRRDRRDHRGRGRGGRGNFRGRDRDRRDDNEKKPAQRSGDGLPTIHTSQEGAKIIAEQDAKQAAEKQEIDDQTNGKRTREDDDTAEPPAKKVDTKAADAETS